MKSRKAKLACGYIAAVLIGCLAGSGLFFSIRARAARPFPPLSVLSLSDMLGEEPPDVTARLHDGQAEIIGINAENDGTVEIPMHIHDYTVTAIADNAFSGTAVTQVTIPDTVTSIGSGAFKDCKGLGSITLPAGLTDIGDSAFAGSGLASVTLPQNVTKMGKSAFEGCGELVYVSLPPVETIPESCFANCPLLRGIVIASGTKVIDTKAFAQCPSIHELTLPATVEKMDSSAVGNESGVLRIYSTRDKKDFGEISCTRWTKLADTTPAPLRTKKDGDGVAITGIASDMPAQLHIPDMIDGKLVTAIADTAFYKFGPKELYLPDSLLSIGDSAFYACESLKKVDMPDSVKVIDNDAFGFCTKLSDITLPKYLEKLGGMAFYNDALTKVTIPDTVTEMGCDVFGMNRKLTEAHVGKIKKLPYGTFLWCSSLKTLTLSEGLEEICENSIQMSKKAKKLVIPKSVKKIHRSGIFMTNCNMYIYAPHSWKYYTGVSNSMPIFTNNWIVRD